VDLQALLDLIGRIGTDEAPDDNALTGARSELRGLLREVVGGDTPDLEAGRTIRQAIDDIDQELAARREHREQEATEAATLLEGLEADEESGDDEPEDDEDEADPPEQEPETTDHGTSRSVDLASAVRRANARVQANAVPEPTSAVRALGMGPAAGAIEDPNLDLDGAADVFHRYNRHIGRQGRQALIRLEFSYPEDRQFGMSVEENTRMVNRLVEPRAIVAAGGICDPLPADFSHPIIGNRGRPIRDALPSFNADRGGLRFMPAATLGDLSDLVPSPITVWTHETDAEPLTETKGCPALTCDTESEAKVDAIVRCLTIGNFQAKFNPEFWRSRLDLLLVMHDQVAEQTLFAELQANAADVTWAADPNTGTGTARNALRALDRAVAGLRSRYRITDGQAVNWIAPEWVRAALRSSLTAQVPGDDSTMFSAADALITGFLQSRNVRPIWSPDIQIFAAQAAGALNEFPATANTILYPEGTFLFLDGGTYDLGIEVTDTTTNSTNDRQAFAETFEAVAYRGAEAIELILPIGDDCNCNPPDAI
jgi:hypothetical protein